MKTNLKMLLSFLVLGLIATNSLFAQSVGDVPSAHATNDGVITFDVNEPLSGFYVFDFSDFNYSEAEARNIANNLAAINSALNTQLDYPNQKILIMIDLTDPVVEGWDVSIWNTHLIKAQKED